MFARRIHTGKRPYKCVDPKCGKSFVHKTVLTKHMKMVHDSTIRAGGVSLESQDHNTAEVSSPSSSSSSSTPPYDTSASYFSPPSSLPKQPCYHPYYTLDRFHDEASMRRDSAISLGYNHSDYARYSSYPSFFAWKRPLTLYYQLTELGETGYKVTRPPSHIAVFFPLSLMAWHYSHDGWWLLPPFVSS
jgi:hypothetical protein